MNFGAAAFKTAEGSNMAAPVIALIFVKCLLFIVDGFILISLQNPNVCVMRVIIQEACCAQS